MPPKKRVTRFKLYKFQIQAILTEHDDSGEPMAEKTTNVMELFSVSQLHKYADDFPGELTKINQDMVDNGIES